MRGPREIRLTPRGRAMLLAAVAGVLVGTFGGIEVMTQAGVLLLLAVGVGAVALLAERRAEGRGGLRLVRRVVPHPTQVGVRTVVEVHLESAHRHRLDRLQIAERASRELSGSTPLRARVVRAPDRITLAYPVEPSRRGRWAVGPVEIQRRDVFGTLTARGPLGGTMLVAVRPAVTPLAMADSSASTDVDRAALGTRTPAPDDASLRDYRTGDDLRRVHWPSSARRGELVVRQDERSGRRPASVLLDLPVDDGDAEWSISLAASAALALMSSGHHVRLLGGDVVGTEVDHHHAGRDGLGADLLLDQTVDLRRPSGAVERRAWFLAAIDTLTAEGGGAEVLLAVVGALDPAALAGLARVGDGGHAWAMVRTAAAAPTPAEHETLDGLRRAGWTACAVTPGEPHDAAWARLLDSRTDVAVAR